MPYPNSLHLRSSWGGVLNVLSKSNINVSTCTSLFKILAQSFITISNWVSQLCFFLNACMLPIWQETVFFKVIHGVWIYYVLKSLAENACEWEMAIMACQSPVTFRKQGTDVYQKPSSGITPVSTDCWNKCAKTGSSSTASSFKILGCNLSGPIAIVDSDLSED